MAAYEYDHVLREIERLHCAGDFIKTSKYIASISDDAKSDQLVAIWAANHYVGIGHLAKAAKILEAFNYLLLAQPDQVFLDENMAVLALLHAVIGIYRDSEWRKALDLVQTIDDIYVHQKRTQAVSTYRLSEMLVFPNLSIYRKSPRNQRIRVPDKSNS